MTKRTHIYENVPCAVCGGRGYTYTQYGARIHCHTCHGHGFHEVHVGVEDEHTNFQENRRMEAGRKLLWAMGLFLAGIAFLMSSLWYFSLILIPIAIVMFIQSQRT